MFTQLVKSCRVVHDLDQVSSISLLLWLLIRLYPKKKKIQVERKIKSWDVIYIGAQCQLLVFGRILLSHKLVSFSYQWFVSENERVNRHIQISFECTSRIGLHDQSFMKPKQVKHFLLRNGPHLHFPLFNISLSIPYGHNRLITCFWPNF